MPESGKLYCFIAASTDGYIATNDDDLSFLSAVEQEGEDYGYAAFMQQIDAVLIGRKTYEKVLTMGIDFPHANKPCYVITGTPKPPLGSTRFYTGDVKELVLQLCKVEGKNVFVDGGAQLIHHLLMNNLIDEFIISIIPVLLGDGIALFKPGRPAMPLKLLNSTAFPKGLVQMHYTKG